MGDRKNKLYGYDNGYDSGCTMRLFMCADTNMERAVAFECRRVEPPFEAKVVIPVLSKNEIKELIEHLKELYEWMD